jgi:hypothetical protein
MILTSGLQVATLPPRTRSSCRSRVFDRTGRPSNSEKLARAAAHFCNPTPGSIPSARQALGLSGLLQVSFCPVVGQEVLSQGRSRRFDRTAVKHPHSDNYTSASWQRQEPGFVYDRLHLLFSGQHHCDVGRRDTRRRRQGCDCGGKGTTVPVLTAWSSARFGPLLVLAHRVWPSRPKVSLTTQQQGRHSSSN